MAGPHDISLHLTERVRAPASQAVVEARLAGERECRTSLGGFVQFLKTNFLRRRSASLVLLGRELN